MFDRIVTEECGCRYDIGLGTYIEFCTRHRKKGFKIPDYQIDNLNTILQAATSRCIYRVNGLCDATCEAHDYCQPIALGLKIVEDTDAL